MARMTAAEYRQIQQEMRNKYCIAKELPDFVLPPSEPPSPTRQSPQPVKPDDDAISTNAARWD
jgi:hypothetical protein